MNRAKAGTAIVALACVLAVCAAVAKRMDECINKIAGKSEALTPAPDGGG